MVKLSEDKKQIIKIRKNYQKSNYYWILKQMKIYIIMEIIKY